ncbi:MAG: hypothetical protein COY58_09345 [Gammaproteobacteria bacterium CG_4_10_14_0_8_um_filter_38_16]|nr:MAG: hypothetical protein COY58_09345 [Gammaproteobacteria bacterium CG_4_10_14_0_8_um_filter_38_16]PJA03105.1 MAG: hypothetical protein COX72_07320 [Gammaproteobacteria bacterium CG_4_10_14_0_2_um_filter_38_22]PJB10275.1 MAG: hypothetical protein CO120_05585 [Gammaproteobacteria bacterium CG_4_9_14_3_um_filter_38_9]
MGRWSKEARKKQSRLIHQWKPWAQSTGAKTETGKAVSKMNALKHGARSSNMRKLSQLIIDHKKALNELLDGSI